MLGACDKVGGIEKRRLHSKANAVTSDQGVKSFYLYALTEQEVRENADDDQTAGDKKAKFKLGKTAFRPFAHVLILWCPSVAPQVLSAAWSGFSFTVFQYKDCGLTWGTSRFEWAVNLVQNSCGRLEAVRSWLDHGLRP